MNTETGEIRILLVDDHQLLLQGLRHLISSVPGMRVVGEALHGQGAMDQIRVSTPDLVLMDIHLAGESGVDVTRRVLDEFPTLKVIALSSDSNLQTILDALYAGVAGYLIKQSGSEEMIRAIRAVMEDCLYLAPELASMVVREFIRSSAAGRLTPGAMALTERERLLLKLIAQGKRNKEIAHTMAVAAKSPETYRARLMKKLGCANTAELIRYAIREGIIQP